MLEINNELLKCSVSFTFKTDKDDKNPITVNTTIDFSNHTAEHIMERACADAVIDLQRRLRSGKVSLNDKAAVIVDGKETAPAIVGVMGKTWVLPVPGTKTRMSPEAKIMGLAEKLGVTTEQLAEMLKKMKDAGHTA